MGKIRSLPIRSIVLDATALELAADPRSDLRTALRRWQEDGADLLTCAVTLTEVLRGHPREALLHRLLGSLGIRAVDEHLGRAAGERIGRSSAHGNVTVDAIIAELASSLPRPVVVLTADVDDITALVDDDVMVLDIAA